MISSDHAEWRRRFYCHRGTRSRHGVTHWLAELCRLDNNQIVPGSQECAFAIKRLSPLLGDRKDQRFAVAAAVTTEVSGEVGRSVHDKLGGTGR
jgi:hypothetical protein